MANEKGTAHSMINSLIGLNELKNMTSLKGLVSQHPPYTKMDALHSGLKGLVDELANRKEAGTYAHPMGDDPNAWNVADAIKAIHQGQDRHLYKQDPYKEMFTITTSNGWSPKDKSTYTKTDPWSTGYRSHDDYEEERAYRKKMLEDANTLDYRIGFDKRERPHLYDEEDEGIDWFNPGRWGQSLKKTILDALTTNER